MTSSVRLPRNKRASQSGQHTFVYTHSRVRAGESSQPVVFSFSSAMVNKFFVIVRALGAKVRAILATDVDNSNGKRRVGGEGKKRQCHLNVFARGESRVLHD